LRNWFGGSAVPTISTRVGVLRVSLGDSGKLTATFVPEAAKPRALALNIALLGNELESDIKRGENSGRKLRHDFVVLDLIRTGMTNESNSWAGSIALPTHLNADKRSAIAAWITEDGMPIQATGGWLQR
jgi:hypothetical protein